MNELLPIYKIFLKGIKMPFERYKDLVRLGLPYALLILLSSFMPNELSGAVPNIIYFSALCVAGVLGTVGCHRVFLLTPEAASKTEIFRWTYRETNFLLRMVGICLLMAIAYAPFFILYIYLRGFEAFANIENKLILELFSTLSFVPSYYIASRWSLILPDSAIDNVRHPSWAWSVSSGQSLRLFVLIGAIPLTTEFIFGFTSTYLESSYIFKLIKNVIWLIVAVIEICLLSLSYKWMLSKAET